MVSSHDLTAALLSDLSKRMDQSNLRGATHHWTLSPGEAALLCKPAQLRLPQDLKPQVASPYHPR